MCRLASGKIANMDPDIPGLREACAWPTIQPTDRSADQPTHRATVPTECSPIRPSARPTAQTTQSVLPPDRLPDRPADRPSGRPSGHQIAKGPRVRPNVRETVRRVEQTADRLPDRPYNRPPQGRHLNRPFDRFTGLSHTGDACSPRNRATADCVMTTHAQHAQVACSSWQSRWSTNRLRPTPTPSAGCSGMSQNLRAPNPDARAHPIAAAFSRPCHRARRPDRVGNRRAQRYCERA